MPRALRQPWKPCRANLLGTSQRLRRGRLARCSAARRPFQASSVALAIYHSHECRRCNHGPRFAHPRLRAPATGTPGPGPGNSSLVVIPSALFNSPCPAVARFVARPPCFKGHWSLQIIKHLNNGQVHPAPGLTMPGGSTPRPRRLTGPGMVWLTTMHGLASTPRPLSPHFLPRSLGRNAAKTPNMTRSRLLGPFASFKSLINC